MASGRAKVGKYKMELGYQIVLQRAKNENREMGSKGGIWNKISQPKRVPCGQSENMLNSKTNDATHGFTDGNDYMNE